MYSHSGKSYEGENTGVRCIGLFAQRHFSRKKNEAVSYLIKLATYKRSSSLLISFVNSNNRQLHYTDSGFTLIYASNWFVIIVTRARLLDLFRDLVPPR
jgi:hypothetical protein